MGGLLVFQFLLQRRSSPRAVSAGLLRYPSTWIHVTDEQYFATPRKFITYRILPPMRTKTLYK